MTLDWITTGAFVAILVAAAVLDLRTGRIPNKLTLGGLVAGLLLRAFGGIEPLAHGVLGAGLALLIALPFFAVRALGGGDAKLLIVVGAFMGEGRLVGALAADRGARRSHRRRRGGASRRHRAGGPEQRGHDEALGYARTEGCTALALESRGGLDPVRGRHRARGHRLVVLGRESAMKPLKFVRRGQAVVEFALVLPLILIMVISVFEFARAWNIQQVLTDAAREGARVAVVGAGNEEAEGPLKAKVTAEIKRRTLGGRDRSERRLVYDAGRGGWP